MHENVDQMCMYIGQQLTNEYHDVVPMTPVVSSVKEKSDENITTKLGTQYFHYTILCCVGGPLLAMALICEKCV